LRAFKNEIKQKKTKKIKKDKPKVNLAKYNQPILHKQSEKKVLKRKAKELKKELENVRRFKHTKKYSCSY